MPARYDAIKRSLLDEGKSTDTAKRIAAATYEKTRKPGEEHIQTVAAREKRRRWRGMTTDDAAGALAARE